MVNETEIVVVAEMTAQSGKADALRRAIEAAIPSTRAEKGNSVFRLHEDRKTPGHFVLYERFDDGGDACLGHDWGAERRDGRRPADPAGQRPIAGARTAAAKRRRTGPAGPGQKDD